MTNKAIRMRGDTLIAMLHPEVDMVVYLSEDVLVRPAGHVGEMRAGLERTGQAAAATEIAARGQRGPLMHWSQATTPRCVPDTARQNALANPLVR